MNTLITFSLFLTFITLALSHGILVLPPPRYGTDKAPGTKNPGVPTDQQLNTCGLGDTGPGIITVTYQAGTPITVYWNTTIVHPNPPGVRVAVQYSPTDPFNNNVLASELEIGSVGLHSVNVTLPKDKVCDKCVLQWMWVTYADGGYYIGCSDIRIQSDPVKSINYTYPTAPGGKYH
eukprot:TRINITY_DN1279_c0_g1_i2.p1 TRINITY_DN1279_c0_g1~~TRINITY_DN1279_c0_g1_i2.p1  ORF type:complete len:177 (+),score=28.15 TRINITY_DN1279_c0_g1_i2:502-1032(+)